MADATHHHKTAVSDYPFVSRETSQLLKQYTALLKKWQGAINLISPNTIDSIEERHIADSLQLYPLLPEPCDHLVDLGSGAGLPGLILALCGVPRVTLVESDTRKSVFLKTAVRELGLSNVSVINKRAEDVLSLAVDCVTARALGTLEMLLSLSLPLVRPGGTLLFPKGAQYQDELKMSNIPDSLTTETIPSQTDPDAAIIRITCP